MNDINRDYIPAKLCKRGNDWYAYYSVRNPLTGEMHRFKDRKQINYIKDLRKRTAAGNTLVEAINQLLREGWTPFPDAEKKLSLLELIQKELDLKKVRDARKKKLGERKKKQVELSYQ